MGTGSRKDVPPPSPEKAPSADSEGLLTSQDLFGDLVDAPLEGAPPTRKAQREGPIRVQIAEEGAAQLAAKKAAAPAPELKAEEMAALLDAFSGPEPAPAAPPKPEPAPAAPEPEEAEEDLGALLDDLAPAPAEEAPATVTPAAQEPPSAEAAAEEEEDLGALLDSLAPPPDPDQTLLPTPAPPPTPAKSPDETVRPGELFFSTEAGFEAQSARPAPARAKTGDVDQLLEGILSPSAPSRSAAKKTEDSLLDLPGLGDLLAAAQAPTAPAPSSAPAAEAPQAEVEPAAARLGSKFAAADPKIAATAETRMMLDLAGIAENAFANPPGPAPSPVKPGDEGFGPYKLIEKVAAGGMAEVWKAKRTGVEGFEKVVAVKRILPHLSDNKEFVEMFIDEAKVVAGLTHPNVVQIFDLGRLEATYYIAMEFVHGRDLRSILRRAKDRGLRIPLDLSVLIVSRVCSALEYAHRKKDESGRAMKIVHRDVSPQNILISFEGEVKLTDFGIAKAATKAGDTEKGALRGKLLYMSPEQAWGKPIDRRSDLFSLGVVFYEMVTDRKPFLATSERSILEAVRESRIPPPTAHNPRIPERIERVVMKALERDPETRYQDAAEMYRDLERALHERQPPTSAELARFMEILFEREERGDAVPDEHTSGKHRPAEGLEIDLDSGEHLAEDVAAPADERKSPGIGKLLKRFGIK